MTSPVQPSAEKLALDHLLVRVAHLHFARAMTLFQTVGLYRGQPPVLGALVQQEGLSHSELAARLHIRPATMSKMLDRMEKAGFVTRRPDPQDQRVSRVYLPEHGRAVAAQVDELIATMARDTFGGFSPEECALLAGFLERMRANLETASLKAAGQATVDGQGSEGSAR